jgi:hypothetical protein
MPMPCASQDLLREMRVYKGAGYACLYAPVRATTAAQAAGCWGPVHAKAPPIWRGRAAGPIMAPHQ